MTLRPFKVFILLLHSKLLQNFAVSKSKHLITQAVLVSYKFTSDLARWFWLVVSQKYTVSVLPKTAII